MGIITEYLVSQQAYEREYGDRTVVLIQIGSFYEIYAYDPSYCTTEQAKIDKTGKKWDNPIGHAVELSSILNMILTCEDNSQPYGINNPHKIGFPLIAYEKNKNTLLTNDYVIVRIDQDKRANQGKTMKRIVGEICSPTMQIDNTVKVSNNIVSIYIEYQKSREETGRKMPDNFLITAGIAVIDIITGVNYVGEFYSKTDDEIFPIQEIYRFLISHNPKEIILYLEDFPDDPLVKDIYVKYLEKVLELSRYNRVITHINTLPPEFKKVSYQIEFFNKVFGSNIQEPVNKVPTTGGVEISKSGDARITRGNSPEKSSPQEIGKGNTRNGGKGITLILSDTSKLSDFSKSLKPAGQISFSLSATPKSVTPTVSPIVLIPPTVSPMVLIPPTVSPIVPTVSPTVSPIVPTPPTVSPTVSPVVLNSPISPTVSSIPTSHGPKEEVFSEIPAIKIMNEKIIYRRNDSIISQLGLERMKYGILSYIALIQYCYSHNSAIIESLSKPDVQWLDYGKYLILTHNAIEQLNVLSNPSSKSTGVSLVTTSKGTVSLSNERSAKSGRRMIDSLESILDFNVTNLGKRALHYMMLNPMSNPSDIQRYYNMVNEMLSCKVSDVDLWKYIGQSFKGLTDIERLHRRLEMKRITPKDITGLQYSYFLIYNLARQLRQLPIPNLQMLLPNQQEWNNFEDFLRMMERTFILERLECCYIETESSVEWFQFTNYPFKQGIYPDIDQVVNSVESRQRYLDQIVDLLNKSGKIISKITNRKDGTLLIVNNINVQYLSEQIKVIGSQYPVLNDVTFLPYTNKDKILSSSSIKVIIDELNRSTDWLGNKLLEIYGQLLERMRQYTFRKSLNYMIARLDLVQSYAKVSSMYGYHCPEIVLSGTKPRQNTCCTGEIVLSGTKPRQNTCYTGEIILSTRDFQQNTCCTGEIVLSHKQQTNTATATVSASGEEKNQDMEDISFLEMERLRHPIIERIIDGQYICNDISLGLGSKKGCGSLLFGINQTGKSSLTKAVGLNIIMAQIGCFTACKLRYYPYKKIITRSTNSDNLFRGMSTFALELTELRTILRHADANTLVIGDELCHGTEVNSGIAITAGTISTLVEKKSSFIFATHMHDILNVSVINKLIDNKELDVKHLSVSYDQTSKILIYDRLLKDGSGPSIYGLLVAESLDLPESFINTARNILNEVLKRDSMIVSTKTSRYNQDVYLDHCAICKRSKLQVTLHTHHIQEQMLANIHGLIDSQTGIMSKNMKDNLLVLCEKCHSDLHLSNSQLNVLETSRGKIVEKILGE